MRLEGKIALVTGAGKDSRGIGQGIAVALAREGADVAVASHTLANALRVADAVQTLGRRSLAVEMDVSRAESVEAGVAEVLSAFGRIDILVNNAGITRDALLVRMREEDWDAVLDVNLKGAFLCSRAVARVMMKQRSGCIINITSIMGLTGNAGQVNYASAKAGLIGFTKSLARELGSRNIRVNAVAPGWIETAMTDALPDQVREAILKQIPLGRLGRAEDVAGAVVFLCSEEASYITGQVLTVDGGLVMI
ncbi:3-oxoacyl-[acyl-carrier-protein] reductase FabG [bacterium HR16]|nr:3-oxoacyl-[acyl-carrier-protein] reductase FabG [bacterium HR16]